MLIPRESLRTALKKLLAERIVRGALSPGAPINLAELAEAVGVSVTPLREALIELEREGLVRSVLNRGYFVCPLDQAEMHELYPIIGALEAMALRAGPPSAALLRELETLNARRRRERSPARRIDLDDRWHAKLLSECPNATLLRLLETLKRRLYRYEYAFMSDESLSRDSAGEHDAIVAALEKGHVKRAAALLDHNWRVSPGTLEDTVERLRALNAKVRAPRRRIRPTKEN